jgi:serine/threonine-protein kinase RsbW
MAARRRMAVARLAVSAVASRMNFDVEAIEDIKVAVGEACNNAMEHGCPAPPGSDMISLRCELEEEALVITVMDSGDGFDPTTAVRQRPHGTATLSERGLGMLLIESLMDEVNFVSNPGDGTQVRMVKRLRHVEGS